ncbi:MAG: histidinol-phosphatase [Melioribacteraceae bacterium]|nr:histidinol-phosphatase [Melioribacteraceae bacterium]
MSSVNELIEFKKFCKLLTESSGKNISKYFRTNIGIETKSDDSPVTIADKTTEEKLRELIMKEYPEHGILGEEFGKHNEGAEYQWILDPIDGTKSFICGAITFGTLIGLMKNGKPILGVFHQPILNEFLIGDNTETLLNASKVNVNDVTNLEQAVLLTTDHLNIDEFQNLLNFEKLMRKVKLYRQWGDCYGYYLLASGFAQIMIDPIMSVWDTMALIPIIKGAGGIITDYQGNDAVTGESIVAATPNIHSEVIKILNN